MNQRIPDLTLGRIFATPGALEALEQACQLPDDFLARHVRRDWGRISKGDRRLNDAAVLNGDRILSAYETSLGVRLWIITEATDDEGHRSATTLLLPDEY